MWHFLKILLYENKTEVCVMLYCHKPALEVLQEILHPSVRMKYFILNKDLSNYLQSIYFHAVTLLHLLIKM